MSLDNTPEWLGGVAAVVGVCLAYLRKVFVTNRELHRLLKEQETQRENVRAAQHSENLANFGKLFDKVGAVEQRMAHLEGAISGRYPRPGR